VTREELEHVIRAAGEIADDDLVVIGSQAILGTYPDAPEALLFSMEADLFPLRASEAGRAVDSAMGDGSPFHEAFGYYAHGVGRDTARAPVGWEERLVSVEVPPLTGAQRRRVGWCMEPHDLMLAKLARGDERDWQFVEVAVRGGLVEIDLLRLRSQSMPEADRAVVVERLEGVIARAGGGGRSGLRAR
jgi:hypothetical protein